MKFEEKLMALRKSRGWSQEELGEKLGVTRQTVSKWELGATTPEMEKLAAMSELFGISIDELVNGESMEFVNEQKLPDGEKKRMFVNGEYKSKKTLCGMPLVHVTSHGTAKGFVAVGLRAQGIISIGLLSIGVLSIGLLAFGVIAFGMFALGGAANGMIAAGIFAMGGVSIGIFSFGGVAFGWLSFGGFSVGKYAIGGYASGDLAVGGTAHGIVAFGDKATGETALTGSITAAELADIIRSKLPDTPEFIVKMFSWFAENTNSN